MLFCAEIMRFLKLLRAPQSSGMTTLLHKVQQPIAQCELSSARKKLFPLDDGLIMPLPTSPFFEIFVDIIAVDSRCKVWSTTS
jgi:hypothetical protein